MDEDQSVQLIVILTRGDNFVKYTTPEEGNRVVREFYGGHKKIRIFTDGCEHVFNCDHIVRVSSVRRG